VDLDASKTMGQGKIQLRNLSGQVVLDQVVQDGEQQYEFNLNEIPHMSTGIYILSVITEGGSFTEKLFIQF
jgi:hypothetical protein